MIYFISVKFREMCAKKKEWRRTIKESERVSEKFNAVCLSQGAELAVLLHLAECERFFPRLASLEDEIRHLAPPLCVTGDFLGTLSMNSE